MGKRMCLELAGRRERKSGPRQRDYLLWGRFLTVELVSQAEDSASGAVLANRRTLAPGGTRESSITGRGNRSRSEFVWNTFDAPDKSVVDLPTHEGAQRGSAASRAYETRKHSTISRHRGRRRTGDRGTDRGGERWITKRRSASQASQCEHARPQAGAYRTQPAIALVPKQTLTGNGRPRAVTQSLNLGGA